MNPLDPTFLVYLILALFVIFILFAFFTRASWRRVGAVLVSSIPIIFLVMGYDKIAAQFGWWWYPSVMTGSAPLDWYISSALIYGASLGLIGWRVIRRWSWTGLVVFLIVFTAFGVTRDYIYSTTTSFIRFGPGLIPLLADCFAYASSALIVQALMYWLAGRPDTDQLARVRKSGESH